MINKNIVTVAFILTVLAQLFVPGKMIWDREDVINNGIEHKFKTIPVDPNDPFRGKYITLNYLENRIEVENEKYWTSGELVYVSFKTDNNGFSKIKSVSKTKPNDNHDFLKAEVLGVLSDTNATQLTINYPFDRYYMEESKAYDAEKTHRKAQIDTTTTTYALVNIKHGVAVLKDVLIDGISIREIVKSDQRE